MFTNGIFDLPIIARFTEYNAVITRMPDKSAFTFNLVWMRPVNVPAHAPNRKTTGNDNQALYPLLSITAVTAPPKVKLPSVVISGMLKILIEMKIPIDKEANPNPRSTADKYKSAIVRLVS